MADSRAALAEGQTLREGTSRAFSSRRTDEPAWKAARGWIVATLVALLAVGPATAAVSQTSPAPTPSPSAPVLTPEPAIPTPSPSAEPIITPEPAPADDLPKDGDALSQEDTAAADSPANVDGTAKVDESAPEPESAIAPAQMAPANATGGPWRYWISSSNPGSGQQVSGGQTVTYTLNAQNSSLIGTVRGAVVTLSLAGDATFVPNSNVTLSSDRKTLSWNVADLTSYLIGRGSDSISVTATIDPGTSGGNVTATISDNGDPNGSFYSGGSRTAVVEHAVLGPAVGDCNFATPGSGDYAQSICWFDLAGYDTALATSNSGQQMRQVLPNGYELSYTLTTTGSGRANLSSQALPTWTGGFLGNQAFPGSYYEIPGEPALYQGVNSQYTEVELTDIVLRTSGGEEVQGFALVGADAESTDQGESITWTSDQPFTSIGQLGNACGGALQFSADSTQVTCGQTSGGTKTGTAIVYSQDPEVFSQAMQGGGLQGVAFGVMVSGVRVTKQIVNPVMEADAFEITAARGAAVLGAATTDDSGFADTGQIHLISTGTDTTVVLSEQPVVGTDATNYAATWACTKNNEFYAPHGGDSSKTVTVAFGDFVDCEITNTGPTLTLNKTVNNTAGGSLTPANWTLVATNSADADVISEAPSHAVSTGGTVVTAATDTVAVPVDQYTLSELSSVAGHDAYAAGPWECSADGQNLPVVDDAVTVAAGAQITCGITNSYLPTASVSITKQVLDTAGQPLADASGWSLGAQLDSSSTSGIQISPAFTQITGESGAVAQPWTVDFPSAEATAHVTVFEQPQPGYEFVSGTCTITSAGAPDRTVTITDSAGTVVPDIAAGDLVDCTLTNQQQAGSVTWSKVADDAAATLLGGSEWTLSGPDVPANTVVIDCTTGTCIDTAFTDQAPTAGQFELANLAWGEYTLTESKAPAGYKLDAATTHTFTISATALTASLGQIVNEQLAVPELPLTGGLSTDIFLALGTGLMAAAVIGALIYRRRSAAVSPQ